MPLYQTSAYVFDSAEHASSLFNLQTFGNIYTRLSNPTTAAFEERMAALEGGRAAVATASGMAAEMTAILTLLESGDHIVAAKSLYGGTHTLLTVNLPKLGIDCTLVDADDPSAFEAAITDKTRLVYAEALGNPGINVLDIAAIARCGPRSRRPLDDRRNFRNAIPLQTHRTRRGYRRPFGNQIYLWSRYVYWRRHR